jgi:hypothetical protein
MVKPGGVSVEEQGADATALPLWYAAQAVSV